MIKKKPHTSSSIASRKPAALRRDAVDYRNRTMDGGLALGVIKRIYWPDSTGNQNMLSHGAPGFWAEAEVGIVRYPRPQSGGSTDTQFTVRAAVPLGSGSFENFSEQIPRSMDLDPIPWKKGQSLSELDGDFVVVGFLGGHQAYPMVIAHVPNPAGHPDRAMEADGARSYKRWNGVRQKIDDEGNLVLDLVEANRKLTVPADTAGNRKASNTTRTNQLAGGDADLYLKKSKIFTFHFEDQATKAGNADNPADQRYLETSNAQVYTDDAGEVTWETSADARIKSPSVITVDSAKASAGVKLGGDLAVRQNARIYDSVQVTFGSITLTGQITSGSDKVRSE